MNPQGPLAEPFPMFSGKAKEATSSYVELLENSEVCSGRGGQTSVL